MAIGEWVKKIKEILQAKIFLGKQEINIIINFYPGGVGKDARNFVEERNYHLIRETLKDEFKEYCKITEKDVLQKIAPYIPANLYSCFLLAVKVIEAENKGNFDKMDRLFETLIQRFPGIGRKVYNLLRSEEFQNNVLPYLELLKSTCKSEREIREKFTNLLQDVLNFYPFAEWVNIDVPEEKVVRNVMDKLKLSPIVKIYGRGKALEKVKRIRERLEELLNEKEKHKYIIQEKVFILGRTKAIEVTIVDVERYLNL